MIGFNNQLVPDDYGDTSPQCCIRDKWWSVGGMFAVSNTAAVYIELQWAEYDNAQGAYDWQNEIYLPAGSTGTVPPKCKGMRFRNAVAGQTASVTAWIMESGEIPVNIQTSTVSGSSSSAAPTTISNGETLGTNGTPTPITNVSTLCVAVVVRAKKTNSGNVYLGNASVTTADGYILSPGDAVAIDISDVSTVHFDVDNTNDGVSWLSVQ